MDDKQDKVPCEPCGGTGNYCPTGVECHLRDVPKTCPSCHGLGKRYLNMGDVREGWENGFKQAHPSNSPDFECWVKERYGN